MSTQSFCRYLLGASVFLEASTGVFLAAPARSQVIPDQTLGESSTVLSAPSAIELVITGGAQRNRNLFHSFNEFSLESGWAVLFEHSSTVETIFARVTGGNVSSIDGEIGISGSADLFFINPAGISFGRNASIKTNGNFIGTSASRIIFADGQEFGDADSPLLSTNIPIGLGFIGGNPIVVEGGGHTLSGGSTFPLGETSPQEGLFTATDRTIALIGGDVFLDGGVVRSLSGNIVLGSVQAGVVNLDFENLRPDFLFSAVDSFGTISLNNFSLLDVGRSGDGSVNITGGDINLLESSVITAFGIYEGDSGAAIKISGESILIDGEISRLPEDEGDFSVVGSSNFIPAALVLDSFSSEGSGRIEIDALEVSLVNGGSMFSRSFGEGVPGSVYVNSDKLSVSGTNPVNLLSSSISAASFSTSPPDSSVSGEIAIDSEEIDINNGGGITNSTFGPASGGKIQIDSEDLLVRSSAQILGTPSQISALSLQIGISPTMGDGGEIDVSTNTLRVLEGGAIGTSTDNSGDAGSLRINVRDFVEVDSSVSSSVGPSRIGSDIVRFSQQLRDEFGFDGIPSGEGGVVAINAPDLRVQNGGLIAVRNEGTGSAGNLIIRGDSLFVGKDAQISASTVQGDGGNINIFSDLMLLSNGNINATSAQTGSGGNVNIQSDTAVLQEESNITANASQGTGGQVSIDTNLLLLSSDSEITADSASGSNGTVNVRGQDESLQSESQPSPSIATPSTVTACAAAADESSFVSSGRGGLPRSEAALTPDWTGWNRSPGTVRSSRTSEDNEIVEAQGWRKDEDGTVRLVAELPAPYAAVVSSASCLNNSPS